MIRKLPGVNKWRVLSEKSHRNMGTYGSLAKAKERLRQVEFFKARSRWRK